MKNLLSAVAASILTVFPLAPAGHLARATGAPQNRPAAANAQFPGLADQSAASATPSSIAQLRSGTLLAQELSPQTERNSDNPGDDNSSANTDNQDSDADQNTDPDNGSDSNQNAQTDDNDNADQNSGDSVDRGNGGNGGQEPGYANDSQRDNGGDSAGQNSD